MKINRIRIQNFKVFNDFIIDLNSSDVLVFDGPNGYGKTTIYDAIELVFTGKIRRYNDLKSKLIDGRQSYSENPLYNENSVGKDIIITVEYNKNDKLLILERVAKSDQINGVLDFSIYKLFTKTDFESDQRTEVGNEEDFLTSIFGKNYGSNFQFLNYVEQEECLFLLKHPDRKRKEHIGHLFDLREFEAKISRIEELKKRMDALCNQGQKSEIDDLSSEIGQLRANSSNIANVEYVKLFENKDFVWDRDNIDIKTVDYNNVAGSNGILDKLKIFIERKDLFKQHRINRAVNYLLENEALVRSFLRFFSFLPRKEEFRELKNQYINLQSLISLLSNLNNNNLDQTIDFNAYTFIPVEIRTNFLITKEELQNNLQELSGLDKIYSDISISRDQLSEKLTLLKENGDATGECLLCGYDWETVDELLQQIETKAQQIKEINSAKSNRFNESFISFRANIIPQIIELITMQISTLRYDALFVDELLKIQSNHFNDVLRTFTFLKKDYTAFLSNEQTTDVSAAFERIKAEMIDLKSNIDEQLIETYFSDFLQQYFDNNLDGVELISNNNIERKKSYLNYLWSLSQNELLQAKTNALIIKQRRLHQSKETSKKLNDLKTTYNDSLKTYQKKIIKDIEVIFHIYSGRIMQSFQGGLGLFIFSEKDGIRFQSNPTKTYDAVFSMSSGQLSALVISFTLALHKKYSNNKIVLIDDPVQTMDELNLYGFIDLLRNEFRDNQIIMSTHEDMMSAFMRYKFKNFNLSEKRINLKEIA